MLLYKVMHLLLITSPTLKNCGMNCPICSLYHLVCVVLQEYFFTLLSLTKLCNFFMGLNEEFDNSKDHILLRDPLPSLSKVYSMVLKVEKQHMANMMKTFHAEMTALLVKTYGSSNRHNNDARGNLQSRFGNGNDITQSY